MPFLGTILLMAALISVVLAPVFVGHGLAGGAPAFLAVGVGFVPVAALFIFLFSKVAGRKERR